MKNPTHDDYVRFIQQSIDSICPYKSNEALHRLYHAGFLAGYLAKILEKDQYNLREFKQQIDYLKKLNKTL